MRSFLRRLEQQNIIVIIITTRADTATMLTTGTETSTTGKSVAGTALKNISGNMNRKFSMY